MEKVLCKISGENFAIDCTVKGDALHPQLLKEIQKDFPDFLESEYISHNLLMTYIDRTINRLEQAPAIELSTSAIPDPNAIDEQLTFGEKLADKIADFGGSWTFILSFLFFLVVWMAINAILFHEKGFDPYPFILLNLLLSCLAALQAPVIMMSQNRQEDRDRERAQQDYVINLKSEAEIRTLHQKVDRLMEKL